jgi:hypothetical protein
MLSKKQQLLALRNNKELIGQLIRQAGQGGGAIDPETVKKVFKIVKTAAPIVKKVSLVVFKEFVKPLIKKIREKRKKKKAAKKKSSGGALRLAGQGKRFGIPGSVITTKKGQGLGLAGGRSGRGLGLAGGATKMRVTMTKFGRPSKKKPRKRF